MANEPHTSSHGAHDHHHADGSACRHAHDHALSAEAALERARARCGDLGIRMTPIREQVLTALFADHRPMGAYDLVAKLKGKHGKPLPPITIYRALDVLQEQGFVHRLSSLNAFIACPHGHGPDSVVAFLICEVCGGVDEIADGPMIEGVIGTARRSGFTPRRAAIELSGRCEHCGETADA